MATAPSAVMRFASDIAANSSFRVRSFLQYGAAVRA
jgi:hypothetical protein